MDYIPENEREGLFPVGRLDKDTEGFLILTDDGKFGFRVSEPKSLIEKTYFFWAKGTLDEEKIKRLEEGVGIYNDPDMITAPARVKKICEAKLRDISHLLDEDEAKLRLTKRGDVSVTGAMITITEGKKHQVKRMALAVGLRIVYLERVAISGVFLDKTLPRGEFRPLSEDEISKIKGEY
jgi:16S rRNA pseudouridine516 synthase